jgi:hypothetical protein
MSINKLIADYKGSPSNSKGSNVRDAVNQLIDAHVPHLKALPTAAKAQTDTIYNVAGFYAGSTNGGGRVIYRTDLPKSLHNGVSHYSPEALAAWNGTQAGITTLLNWTGTGSGVFVRLLEGYVTPEMAGAVGDGTTADGPSIQKMVDYALSTATVAQLEESYLSTSSVSNIHKIEITGRGRLVRAGNSYYATPSSGSAQTRNLYVSPSGNDTNDGLSSSQPLKTLQAACDVIQKSRDEFCRWRVNIAAGEYTDGCALSAVAQKDRRIVFAGPAVALNAVPTAIINGIASTYDYGFNFDGCGNIEISDVKIINFKDNEESSAGILAANTRLIRLINVHAERCGVGYSMRSFTFYFVTGGKINNCRYGILELFGVVRNFETVSSIADGTKIQDCVYGLFAKELCTGHLDWVSITGCQYGVYMSRLSTANASDAVIKQNFYGVNLRNSSFLVPNRVDWGAGTAFANTVQFTKDSTSNFVTNEGTTQAGGSLSQGEATLGVITPENPISHTGTTAATTMISSMGSLPAGCMTQAGTYVRALVLGRKTGASANATIECRIGSVSGAATVVPAGATTFKAEFWIISRGKNLQLAFATLTADVPQPAATGRNLRTVDVETGGASFPLRVTLGNASDEILIDAAILYTTDVANPVQNSNPGTFTDRP